MNEFALSTFSSTAGAITAQKLLNGLVSFQVMPVLREISASCGIALRFSPDDLELTKHTLAQADLPGGFALYRIQDCAPHKQITFLYNSTLRFVDATEEEHFRAMSLIHALGWRDTYVNAIPADFIEQEITDDRWVNVFRENYETGTCNGLLLYRNDIPVSCINFGPARLENYNPGMVCTFDNSAYEGWGEITSFYTHPAERGKHYGGLLIEEALRRLKQNNYKNAFVFVLRENESARRFYAAHGFAWDGTHADIPFPHDTICVDLRYTRAL